MSKHTEGPWSLAEDGAEVFPIDGPKSHVTVAFVNGAAQESQWFSKEEALANARLIAAAPTMLALLREIASQCERRLKNVHDEDIDRYMRLANAAIYAAEGRIE